MTDRIFVDTNVWVYAVDADEPAKQARAREVLDPATTARLVTSAQVLGEFYVTVTRKFERAIGQDIADRMVAPCDVFHPLAPGRLHTRRPPATLTNTRHRARSTASPVQSP